MSNKIVKLSCQPNSLFVGSVTTIGRGRSNGLVLNHTSVLIPSGDCISTVRQQVRVRCFVLQRKLTFLVFKLLSNKTMKCFRLSNFLLVAILLFACLGTFEVQAQTSAEDRVIDLRIKLDDVKARQAELEEQLNYLIDQMDPQNIENSLAGIGSTRPEELRELRRRQLEHQKISIENRIAILTESQGRLETAIADAEADAYHESARLASADSEISDSSVAPSSNPATVNNDSGSTRNSKTRPRRARRAVE